MLKVLKQSKIKHNQAKFGKIRQNSATKTSAQLAKMKHIKAECKKRKKKEAKIQEMPKPEES